MSKDKKTIFIQKDKLLDSNELKNNLTDFELKIVAAKIEAEVGFKDNNRLDLKVFEME